MKDTSRTNKELHEEISVLQKRIKELERSKTTHRQIEETLRLSNEIMTNMSEGVVLVKVSDETIIYANPKFENMFGYEHKELKGKNISIINAFTDKTPKEIAAEITFNLRDKGVWQGEVLNRKKDGTTFWCFAKVSTFNHSINGNVWVAVHADITESKRAEEELWKQYELQRVLLSAIPAYVYIKDTASVYLLGNKQFSELSAIPENEIPGKTDYDFFSEADADCFRKDDAEIIRIGKAKLNYEVKGKDAKGNDIWYSTSKSPFYDASGKRAGLLGICINITDRKRAEEELAAHRERLEELVRERTQELENKTQALEELNAALKVLLRHREEDKKDIEERFLSNVKNLVFPYLEKMKTSRLNERQMSYLNIMETHLNEIISPFLKNIRQFNFTPSETQVATLVKEGKATKDIAKLVGIATSSIDTHRNSIRIKLGLKSRKINLRSYLQSLDE